MSPEMIAAAAAVVVAVVGGTASVIAAYISRQTRENTKPISNGWSAEVLSRLNRIEERSIRLEGGLLAHLQDHFEAEHESTYLGTHRREP